MGENIAIRDVYGATPKKLGEQNKKIAGLKADVASSTKSGIFGKALPERYFNVDISEPGMVSMSAEFAREGLISYVNTFVVSLTTREADPIQSLIVYDKPNMKLCETHCGLSDSYSGASHQAITDLASVRAIPNMTVVTVVDAVETKRTVFTIAGHQGPVYLRLSRTAALVFYPEDMKFGADKSITVREGRNVTTITTGTAFRRALAAVELLEAKGIWAGVVDTHTIKPIDGELIIEYTRETDAIVTVEEYSVCDGLGSAVAKILAEHMPISMIYIGATDFAEFGDYEQLLVKYGYGPESIAEKCERVTKHKRVQKK